MTRSTITTSLSQTPLTIPLVARQPVELSAVLTWF
jgi:hypothetical protein